MQKNNVTKFPFCYGCGVCEITCPHKIISMRLNADGFYAPVIDEPEKCTECGLCLGVCAHNSTELPPREREETKSFAAWSKDRLTRLKCSSGGVGMEIARAAFTQGYKPVLCRFDVRANRAEHYLSQSEEDLLASAGSKYIPNFTVPGFSRLNRREKFLVSGTPCQIDSLRRWARKMRCEDNFVFLDFFCHGAPSMNLWKKYSAMQEKVVGEIEDVSWRNKATGWHDSWAMGFRGGKLGERIVWSDSYCLFLKKKKNLFIQPSDARGRILQILPRGRLLRTRMLRNVQIQKRRVVRGHSYWGLVGAQIREGRGRRECRAFFYGARRRDVARARGNGRVSRRRF